MMMTKRTEKTERRRRDADGLSGRTKRLHANISDEDRKKYSYRFINDTGSRVHDLTVKDDWDVVDASDTRLAGEGDRGEPIKAVLVRKPREFYNDDYAAQQRLIDAQEKAIAGGESPSGDSDGQYVPKGGITMTAGT